MQTECCVLCSFSSFSIIISTFFQRSFSFIFGWHFVWSSNGRQGRRLTVVFYPGFLVELFRFGVASGSSSKLSFVSGDSRRPSLPFRIPFESVWKKFTNNPWKIPRSSAVRSSSFEQLVLHHEFTRWSLFCTGKLSSFASANFHCLSPNRDNHSRSAARLVSLSVSFLRSTSIAGIFATSLSVCWSIRKWTKKEIQNVPPEDRSFSWHCPHFFEESQLQLMFYVFEVAIVVPLFSFFRQSFFICTIPRFAHSLFNVGLLLSSLGSSEGAPPPLRSCFCIISGNARFYRKEKLENALTERDIWRKSDLSRIDYGWHRELSQPVELALIQPAGRIGTF
jgi:hypothetical protein